MVQPLHGNHGNERGGMPADPPSAPAFFSWYALYTRPRHEKSVAIQLRRHAIEHFLPLYETVHRWKNKRARLELPLFPSYLFVRGTRQERVQVLQLPGVQCFVNVAGQPVPVPNNEIEVLRVALDSKLRVTPHPYLSVGRRVRVKAGPFQNSEGILLRHKNNFRVVLSMDLIMRSVVVDVDVADLEVVAA